MREMNTCPMCKKNVSGKHMCTSNVVAVLGTDIDVRYIFASSWGEDWAEDDDYPPPIGKGNRMSKYTPTTEDVRNAYSYDPDGEYRDPIHAASNLRAAMREFDRWLAQHDAEVTKATEERIYAALKAETHYDEDNNLMLTEYWENIEAIVKGEN